MQEALTLVRKEGDFSKRMNKGSEEWPRTRLMNKLKMIIEVKILIYFITYYHYKIILIVQLIKY
jgi:hypothetical protein